MKVCFVSFEYPPNILGGMGTYAEHLVKGLNERGVDTNVITRGDKTCRDGKTYRIAIPDILYWRRFFFINRAINLVQSLNRFHKFDLIHLNGTYPITRRFRIPTVCTLHAPPNLKQIKMAFQLRKFNSVNDITYLLLKNPIGALCDFATAKASDKIICPSPRLMEDILSYRRFFDGNDKISVIPNGIDLRELDSAKGFDDSLLANHGIEKESFLLYMGRLSFVKGVDYLIKAFKKVQKKHPHLKLVIVGRGDSESYLRNIARNSKGIIFFGYVDSLRVKKLLLKTSLALVLPSPVYEVFPTVILEAMGCSKPVIATNVGGNPYIITHGENGFLSRPKDSEDLAKLINVLCENRTLRVEMGMRGRKLVETEFSFDRMVNQTLETYESLLDERSLCYEH